jgi:hypothetical protein
MHKITFNNAHVKAAAEINSRTSGSWLPGTLSIKLQLFSMKL